MVSVLIITFGRVEELLDTLKCINKYKGENIELLILDNNNDDSLKDRIFSVIDSKSIELHYFNEGINYGVAEGRNFLINRAKGDFLITLDDDLEIDDINILIEKVKNYFLQEEYSILAFNIKNYFSREALSHEIPHGNKGLDFSKNLETYYFIGAGHAIKKEVYEECGVYPKDLGKYGGEERDLAFRCINKGFRILYTTDIIIYHKVSPNGRMSRKDELFFRYRNQLIVLNRYMPFPYNITSNIIWSLYHILKNKGVFLDIIKVMAVIVKLKKEQVSNKTISKIKKMKGRVFF